MDKGIVRQYPNQNDQECPREVNGASRLGVILLMIEQGPFLPWVAGCSGDAATFGTMLRRFQVVPSP